MEHLLVTAGELLGPTTPEAKATLESLKAYGWERGSAGEMIQWVGSEDLPCKHKGLSLNP